MKNWIIYQLQTDNTTYSIARQKETKPQMQAGEVVQYELKKNNRVQVISANGQKHEYQIVGQTAGAGAVKSNRPLALRSWPGSATIFQPTLWEFSICSIEIPV